MLSSLFLPTTCRSLAVLLGPVLLAAGCQTADRADPNSTLTTQGDFQELANCYARSANAVASRLATGSDGTRSVSVTTNQAAPTAAGTLSGTNKSAEEAVEGTGAASYRVTFQEQPNNTTRVSGATVGAATQPFTWFETVVPALRDCTNNPDLR